MSSPLSPETRAQIRARLGEFSRLEPWRFYLALVFDWAVIALAIAGVVASGFNGVLTALAVVVVAGRQHALFALLHEGVHARISLSRPLNDRVANLFAGYPVMMSVEAYRANHLEHHRFLNTDRDPDWERKVHRPEWQFPHARSRLLRTFFGYLRGQGLLEAVAVARLLSGLEPRQFFRSASARRALLGRVAYWALLGGLVSSTGHGLAIASLWLGAYALVLPVLMRFRSIGEHFGVENSHELNQTRTAMGPAWERALFTPHHIGFHLEHHLYSSVPFYRLPEFHAWLMNLEDYRRHAHISDSYFSGQPSSVIAQILAPEGTGAPPIDRAA